VEQVARPLLDDPSLPMSTLIYKIVRPEEINDPNHVKTVFDRNHNALYFSRSPIPFQRNPEEGITPTYYKHLGFYAYRKGFLLTFVALPEGEWERFEKLEQLRALEFGYRIRVVLTEHDSIEVDTPRSCSGWRRFSPGGTGERPASGTEGDDGKARRHTEKRRSGPRQASDRSLGAAHFPP